jgi:hypothetical protein
MTQNRLFTKFLRNCKDNESLSRESGLEVQGALFL